MFILDRFELALNNFKRLFKSNIGLIVIFSIMIFVFNVVYSMKESICISTSNNITDNANLRVIGASSDSEITDAAIKRMKEIAHVDIVMNGYSCLITDESIKYDNMNICGIDSIQASYFIGNNVELNDYEIILPNNYRDSGIKVGDILHVSYNKRLSERGGIRESKDYKVIGFYEQPSVPGMEYTTSLVSYNTLYEVLSSLYGVTIEKVKSEIYNNECIYIFVDDVDNVDSVVQTIKNNGFKTAYGLSYSDGLPSFAKMVIVIGSAIIFFLIVMSIIVMNATLNKNILGRYKEIGILKSIGLKEKHIFSILNIEVFMLWGIISIISVFITVIAMKILDLLKVLGSNADLKINLICLFISIIVVYLIMFLTTVFTIKKVSKLKTIEVIRYE